MKKKHRDIVVNGKPYAWLVRGCCTLVIFKDKKVIYEQRREEYSITPELVDSIIRTL
jgi:hypothetical protein